MPEFSPDQPFVPPDLPPPYRPPTPDDYTQVRYTDLDGSSGSAEEAHADFTKQDEGSVEIPDEPGKAGEEAEIRQPVVGKDTSFAATGSGVKETTDTAALPSFDRGTETETREGPQSEARDTENKVVVAEEVGGVAVEGEVESDSKDARAFAPYEGAKGEEAVMETAPIRDEGRAESDGGIDEQPEYEAMRVDDVREGSVAERAIFKKRLQELEESAAGNYSEARRPLHFVAGVEMEVQLVDHPNMWQVWNYPNEPDCQRVLQEGKFLLPTSARPSLTGEERTQALEEFHQEATAYVSALPAGDEHEEVRRQEWLEAIPRFGLSELINFKVYQKFAKPTLGPTAPPKNADYEMLQQFAEASGEIEFRFGDGTLQSGWYDNEKITEVRTTPCSPVKAAQRHQDVMNYMVEVAAEHGCWVAQRGSHLNLSAFQQNDAGVMQPIIGLAPDRRQAGLDSVGGIMAGLQDGAWMTTKSAENAVNYDPDMPREFEVDHRRRALRVLDDRVELRAEAIKGSTAHGLLWMMGGVIYGQQTGVYELRNKGYPSPVIQQGINVERTESFGKEQDLGLQRAIENSKPHKDGGFELEGVYNYLKRHHGTMPLLGTDITLPNDPAKAGANTMILNNLAMRSLRVKDDGALYCTIDTFRQAYENLEGVERDYLRVNLANPTILQTIVDGINRRATALRIGLREVISEEVTFESCPPSERLRKHLNSGVMMIAYGAEYHVSYSRYLQEVAEQTCASTTSEAALYAQFKEAFGLDL